MQNQQTITSEAIANLIEKSNGADFNPLAESDALESRMIDASIKLELIAHETGVDLSKIHCRKTGQPIATLNLTEIEHLLNFHSVKRLTEIADLMDYSGGVSRIWLHTNPENLNKLQSLDPRGFFCYCIGIALRNHHMHYVEDRKRFKTVEGEKIFYNSLVKAWYLTANIPAKELEEANKVLRFFMLCDLHNKKYYRVPWQLMFSSLNNAYERVIFVTPNGSNGGALQSASIAYNPDIRPLLPEEFASMYGVSFIKFCVKKFLEQLNVKSYSDLIQYKHIHTANGFRRTKSNELILEIDDHLTNSTTLNTYSVAHNIARAKRIQEKMSQEAKSKSIVLDSDFELDLVLVKGQDGKLTTLEEKQKEPKVVFEQKQTNQTATIAFSWPKKEE